MLDNDRAGHTRQNIPDKEKKNIFKDIFKPFKKHISKYV